MSYYRDQRQCGPPVRHGKDHREREDRETREASHNQVSLFLTKFSD